MKRLIATAFFILLPAQGFAKDHLKKFRLTGPAAGKPQIFFGAALLGENQSRLLPGVGEFVVREDQTAGKAHIAGTWKQTIFKPGGEVAYAAGEVLDGTLPSLALDAMEHDLNASLELAKNKLPELRSASRVFPARLEVRKNDKGEWEPYWRLDYLTSQGDRLRYLLLSREGKMLEQGNLDWDGVDGRAFVYPQGPKLSSVQEVALHELSGDGTMTGRLLRVFSALDLRVWSPELTFFFAENDRRFDLGQAYFTIEEGYRWLKEHLSVELAHPVDVRLHVGNNGVSNAAFYHEHTIYLGTGDNVTYKDMVRDPSVLIHEGIHSIIDDYAGLPSEGEGGSFNEGFADLFTALILDNPRVGEASYLKGPYRRTLENQLLAYRDFNTGVYQNGSIIGATFWDMKSHLGTELTAKLAFRTLVRLGKGAKFDDFPGAFVAAMDGLLSGEQQNFALETVRKRGWKVP